ncbi:MAG: restriction endonuclease subunit S [bacterium]
MKKLPEGWKEVKLTEVTSLITCGVAARPEYIEEGVPFLSSKNVKANKIFFQNFNCISEETHNQLTKKNKPEKGDILYTRVGSFGDAAVIDFDEEFSIFVSLTLIKPIKELVYSYYLMYLLNSERFKQLAISSTTGIGVQNLNVNAVREFKIPLPPLETQKQIAAVLDKADELRQKRKQANAKLDEFLQSVFLDMFGDPTKNSKGWKECKIVDICAVQTGSTPSREKPEYYNGDIPWVKTGEVINSYIYDTEEHITQEAINKSNCKLFPQNTILVAMYGQGYTRGRAAILKKKATTNQACSAILPSEKINHEFLFNLLKAQYNTLRELGRGGNQPNLNLSMVKNFEIYLPPIGLQNEFAQIVEKVEDLKKKNEASAVKLDDLFNSLLQRAFKGELEFREEALAKV